MTLFAVKIIKFYIVKENNDLLNNSTNIFPWSGYFNIIYNSDLVIFLDDAQYSKNSWHNRNQIVINKQKSWITIPLKKPN